jgi:predicted nuclease of restriction endonuclease-like (RecB) superfamily
MIYIDDPPKRDFYMEMCRVEGWSTRMSEREIAGMRPRLFAILIHGLGLEP